MRKLLLVVLAAALVAAPAYGATRTVKVGDNWFVKPGNANASVKKNTVVRWKNVGDNPHTVKVRKGPVKFNRLLTPGSVFKKKMRRKGTYRIVCTIHPGQKMRLRVR